MKKIINFGLALCIFTLFLSFSAFATPAVTDENKLLTEEQIIRLTQEADAIANECGIDVIMVTKENLGGMSARDYSESFFVSNGYGLGSRKSGVQMLISTGDGDYFVLTHGEGIDAFTDYGLKYLEYNYKVYLTDGNFYGAFSSFLSGVNFLLAEYVTTGVPYDTNKTINGYSQGEFSPTFKLFIGILGGLIIGLIITLYLRSKLKTAVPQPYAGSYVSNFNLRRSNDIYLYSHTTAIRKAENNNNGGGSTTFKGSSGGTFGGSGGKF